MMDINAIDFEKVLEIFTVINKKHTACVIVKLSMYLIRD